MQKELKVDMDWRPPEGWLDDWQKEAFWILLRCSIWAKNVVCKKSEHGWHIRIALRKPIVDELALKLQFLLGDDRVRCKLNYARWKAGIKDWNKLWKCKVRREK